MGSTEPTTDIDIVVQGYTPRYRAEVKKLLGVEGGSKVTDDAHDHGGTTKFGISLRFLASEGAFDDDHDGKADFDLDMDGDIDGQDVRALTAGDAIYLYHRCFWEPLNCDRYPQPIGEMLFDQAVNGGRTTACKLLQRAINSCVMEARAKMGARNAPMLLAVDGVLGTQSVNALVWVRAYPPQGIDALVSAFRNAARERYRQIVARYPDQRKYLDGWLARADQLGR